MSLLLDRRTFLCIVPQGLALLSGSCGRSEVAGTEDEQANKQGREPANKQGEDLPANPGQLRVTFLKAGKADAIIVRTDNSCVVVDTGTDEKADKLCDAVAGLGVTTIDVLIITHFDQDHVGGADALIDAFEIQKVFSTYKSKDSDEVEEYERALEKRGLVPQVLREITRFDLDGASYTVIPPKKEVYGEKTSNDSSLVTRIEWGTTSMLLAGDIEQERIDELVASDTNLSCNLLKVPHHGHAEKNSAVFAQATHPAYAIITSSKSDKEDDEVVEAYEAVGAQVFLTRKGTVVATSDGERLSVAQ